MMPRTMLQLRIEALSHHLEQVREPDGWKQRLDLPVFKVETNVWTWVIEKINAEASAQHSKLRTLITELRCGAITERDGWRKYERVQRASEEIFQECLDLLGGLALRDRIQNERICRVADEYIKELASATGRNQSFSIPGLDARFSSTLRRVAKMQFPEWTVWTLPLVAHEYGRVVMDETGLKTLTMDLALELAVAEVNDDEVLSRLDPTRVELAFRWLGSGQEDGVEQLFPPSSDGERVPTEALCAVYEHQQRRVRVLLADALATLLAGPAYACAALMLRLDPLGGEHRGAALRDGRPDVLDRDRATTILSVLAMMCARLDGTSKTLGEVVTGLEHYWRESVADSHAIPIEDVAPVSQLPPPIDPIRIHEKVQENLVSYRRASYEAGHAIQATDWGDAWAREVERGDPKPPPLPAEGAQIRESLNAAWHARVQATRDLEPTQDEEASARVDAIGEVALALCEAIIKQREEDPRRGDPGGGTPLGPADRPKGPT